MYILIDKRINFYFMNNIRTAYLYHDLTLIPESFQALSYVNVEDVFEETLDHLYTYLFNLGIRTVTIDGYAQEITLEYLEEININMFELYLARYFTCLPNRRSMNLSELWKGKVYLLLHQTNDAWEFATANIKGETFFLAFSNRAIAEQFILQNPVFQQYLALRFPLDQTKKYYVLGCNHQLMLKAGGN